MTYSPALPAAMGYTVELDTSAGYGVTRMLLVDYVTPTYEVGSGSSTEPTKRVRVWNPRDDSAQCFEVLCWFLSGDVFREVNRADVWPAISQGEIPHDNTPASLRAAIVEAAERVANG